MPPAIGTAVCAVGILGLFMLDRDQNARTSKALWVPVAWLLIIGSRPVSGWLLGGPTVDITVDPYLEGSPLDRFVFSTLLAAGLIVLIWRRRQVTTLLRVNGPILLFFIYCFASIFWSDYTFVAFKRWTKAIGDVVMVMIVLTDPDQSAAIRRLLKRTAFLIIPVSVLLIKYYPDLGRSYNQWTWLPSYTGVTTNKNTLGMVCLVFGLGSLWRFLVAYQGERGSKRTRRLIAHSTVLLMVLWLFWVANSMTSLSCFFLTGGLMAFTTLFRVGRKPAAVHFIMALVLSVPLFALFSGLGGGMVESLGRDSTLTGRTEIWRAVLSVSGNPLLGTGYDSFWLGERLHKVWDMTMKGLQEAHNGYLELYLNLGWIGVALLALLIVTGYRNVMAVFREDPNAGNAKLGYFAVGLIYNLTEAGFRMLTPVWFWFLLAIIAVPKPAPAEENLSLDRPTPFAQRDPQVRQLVGARLRKETI